MRQLILAAFALFGLIGVSAIASADHDTGLNRAWFFGDCDDRDPVAVAASYEEGGCSGFGIFFGDFDGDSLAAAIEEEFYDEFAGYIVVTKLYAFKVGGGGTQFVQPIIGRTYGSCTLDLEVEEGPSSTVETTADITGGLWIAWFEIEVCFIK